jgi:hypothetical protein
MFIPPGEIIHESLATSYVLVDALVADLCEGGFSGVVEVVLRETDSFILIANGNVSAVVDKPAKKPAGDTIINSSRTTVEQIAESSRRERGCVSIYGYSPATANSLTGRVNAKPLYVGLSTEFTDLEKMIGKLVRERDREWFIEINTEPAALIHMHDTECRIVNSAGESDTGALDLASNPVLGRLIYECNRARGTFDVYFTQPGEVDQPEKAAADQISASGQEDATTAIAEPEESNVSGVEDAAPEELAPSEFPVEPGRDPEEILLAPNLVESELARLEGSVGAGVQSDLEPPPEIETPFPAGDSIEPQTPDLSIVRDELSPPSADAEAMAEIKRLMGEIARVIEGAAQSVGRPDSFSMSLRAGQLKIAERFPFLDPFAGDFEYLAGEIVFVGRATAEEFVEGLTEALKLAIETMASSTAFADRFRSYLTEDLGKLLAREQVPFEAYGIDQVIQLLVNGDQ